MDLKDSKVNPPNPQLSSLLPVTGSLRYIADRTRPDVLVAVSEISSNATPYPSDGHIKTANLVACAIIHERDKLKAIGFEQ